MMLLDKLSFRNREVLLDGIEYRNCTFEGCRIVYFGHLTTVLASKKFTNCSWPFQGPASNVVNFMAALYVQGGSARELVEATLRNVTAPAPPPNAPARQ
jgi:hypothetical protein